MPKVHVRPLSPGEIAENKRLAAIEAVNAAKRGKKPVSATRGHKGWYNSSIAAIGQRIEHDNRLTDDLYREKWL